MAEGGEISTDTLNVLASGHSNEETTCSVCLEQFKHPKLLPCFHTFCAECVCQLLIGDGAICPLCKKTCELAKHDIDGLPNNFLLEYKIKRKRKSEPICDTCEDNPPSKKFCYDCDQHLCLYCFKMHQVFRTMQTHRVCDVSIITPEANRTVRHAYCAKHRDEVLLFFCKFCNSSICRDCKLTNHEKHDTVDLEDYRNELAKQIEEAIKALQREEEFMKNQRLAVNEYSKVLGKSTVRSKDKVESMRRTLHSAVNNECDALNRGIRNQTTQHKSQLAEYNAYIFTRMQSLAQRKNHIQFDHKLGMTGESNTFLQKNEECAGKKEFLTMEMSFPQIKPFDWAMDDLICNLNHVLTWKHVLVGYVSVDRINNFTVHDTSTMHIAKLQVPRSNKCYIHLKRAPGLTVPMNLAHSVLCCNESGKVIECHRECGLIDIALSGLNLYKIFCDSPFTKKRSVEGKETKKNYCFTTKEQHLTVPDCACSFINIYGKITSLDKNGQVIGDENIKFSRQAVPSSACCLSLRKGDNHVVCICYPEEHLAAVYTQSGEEHSLFSPNTHVSLPSNFHPSAVAAHGRGFVYVTDYENDALYAFDVTNSVVQILLNKDERINRPTALCVDASGRTWVGHSRNQISIFLINHSEIHEDSE